MDPSVYNFAGVMVTIVASIGALGGIYAGMKWALAAAKRPEHTPQMLNDSRLEQLQQSIDAIAIEVERIAEGQRFSTKLLAAREDLAKLPK